MRTQFISRILCSCLFLTLSEVAWCQAPPTFEQALARLGLKIDRVSLYKALRDQRPAARSVAAVELASLKDLDSIPMLRAALIREKEPGVAYNLAASLDQLGSSIGTEHLLAYCRVGEAPNDYEMRAATELADTGNYGCATAVTKYLKSSDVGTRESALLYFRNIPSLTPDVAASLGPALLAATDDSNAFLRDLAGQAVLKIGDEKTRAIYLSKQKRHSKV